jgi:hypothetical protein
MKIKNLIRAIFTATKPYDVPADHTWASPALDKRRAEVRAERAKLEQDAAREAAAKDGATL